MDKLLPLLTGQGSNDGMSLSGISSMDPSGSTPQPAPLSGLPLAGDISGAGEGVQGMSGTKSGSLSGGMTGGLDLQQLLAMLGGQQGGDSGSAPTPPNLSSLFASLGGAGAGTGANLFGGVGQGSFSGFGQAGGMATPSFGQTGGGSQGTSGGTDPLSLIRQALGIGQTAADKFSQLQGTQQQPGATGGATASGGGIDPTGFSLTGDTGTASPYVGTGQGSLVNSFLQDPSIEKLFTSGALTGSDIPPDLYAQLEADPAFLQALTSGQYNTAFQPLGQYDLGTSLNLNDPSLGSPGGTAGFDTGSLGSLGQGLGGLNSLFGLAQDIQSGNPMGILKDLYGLYSNANNLFQLGGPTFSSLLSSLVPEGLTSGLEAGATAGSELLGGALGLAPEAVGGALSFAGGEAALALYPVIQNEIMPLLFGEEGPVEARIKETGAIRRDFPNAWSVLQQANPYFRQLQNAGAMPEEAQNDFLQNLYQQGLYEAAQIPSVSQYTSTEGGRQGKLGAGLLGGGWGGIPAQDVSGITKQTPQLYERAILNSLAGQDILTQRGQTLDTSKYTGGPGSNIATLLGDLSGQAGIGYGDKNPFNVSFMAPPDWVGGPDNLLAQAHMMGWAPGLQPIEGDRVGSWIGSGQYNLTPEQMASFGQGHGLATVQDIFSQLNPNFAQSNLGMDIQSLMGLYGPGGFGTPGQGGPVDLASMIPGMLNTNNNPYEMYGGWTSPAGTTSGG